MARDEDNGFKEWGGYFEAKKSKLEEQFSAASNPFRKSNLFNGISIFVNGLTNPSADELKRTMMVHGGIYHHYERSHTNFIIASNLPDVKVRNMNTSKIISAQWVVDCVQQMRVLDYKPYLLYTNQKTTQPRLNFEKKGNNSTNATDSMTEEVPTTSLLEDELGSILKELQQAAASAKPSEVENKPADSNNSNAARTAVDPLFLSEFYKKSRLHHIATLGSGFKQYICELRQAHGNSPFSKRSELKLLLQPKIGTATTRYVMHIDMDCFFVSVALKKHPELRGLPLAVTHSKGGNSANEVPVHPQADRKAEQELFAQRFEQQLHDNVRADKVRTGFEEKMSLSEIASCSYEARAKGIRNGMFVGQALKLCPELRTTPYDFEGYREVAFALYNTVAQYTLNIEAVSCDELFVELTDLVHELQVEVMSFISHLRQEVHDKTGCPCSAGVGGNKLLARLATKVAKPNGQHLFGEDNLAESMVSTALEVLPGVGHGMTYKLNQAGMYTCGDLQKATLVQLETLLGKKSAQTLYQNCRGIDPRPLVYEQQRKSVSAEVNYGIRFANKAECETFLRQLSAEVHSRLTEIKRKAKHITLKIMVRAADAPVEASKFMGHGVCDSQSKSVPLKYSSDDINVITAHVLRLMNQFDVPAPELRGLGIQLSKLDEPGEEKKKNVIKQMFEKMSEKQKGNAFDSWQRLCKDEKTFHITDKPINKTMAIDECTIKNVKSRTNVLDMLKSAAVNKREETSEEMAMEVPKDPLDDAFMPASSELIDYMSPMETSAQFDPEILAQLPEDIRREVLTFKVEYLRIVDSDERDAKRRQKQNQMLFQKAASATASASATPLPTPSPTEPATVSPLQASDFLPSTSKAAMDKQQQRAKCKSDQIVADYISELPRYVHPAVVRYIEGKEQPAAENPTEAANPPAEDASANDNVLLGNNYKTALANWVATEVPLPNDLELMHIYICDLITRNDLDHIYDVMKHLCRLIKTKRSDSCLWHMAYATIEEKIQDQVRELLGYSICFMENINCAKCTE